MTTPRFQTPCLVFGCFMHSYWIPKNTKLNCKIETKWFITVYNYYLQGCIWCIIWIIVNKMFNKCWKFLHEKSVLKLGPIWFDNTQNFISLTNEYIALNITECFTSILSSFTPLLGPPSWTKSKPNASSLYTLYMPNCLSVLALTTMNQMMINLFSTGDSPHFVEGLLEAIFTKIKQKKSIFLPPPLAMTVLKQDLVCNIVSNFVSLKVI